MVVSYAPAMLSALRAKRQEDIEGRKQTEKERLNIPGLLAGMLSGAYVKGGGKGLDLADILTPEGFFGGAAGGIQPASDDQARNALLGVIGGLGTAQSYQKNIREQGQETFKQGLDIAKIRADIAGNFDVVDKDTPGAIDASKAFPGVYSENVYVKRKSPLDQLLMNPMIGPEILRLIQEGAGGSAPPPPPGFRPE